LGRIDKWYHAALACQFLDAYGIPPELERLSILNMQIVFINIKPKYEFLSVYICICCLFRLIQEKSFGNPGWIESYLLSLTQSGSLVIMHISKMIAEEMGYVLPPIYMLKRSYNFYL